MRFFDPNLTLWENLNNTLMCLYVACAALCVFILICHLTANTKEKKDEAKNFTLYGVVIVIAVIVFSILAQLKKPV